MKTEILLNGKVISAPQFVILLNEPAVIEMHSGNLKTELKMKLNANSFATAKLADGIDLKMEVQYQTMSRNFKANPRVIVAPGEVGVIQMGTDATEILKMRVVAERQ